MKSREDTGMTEAQIRFGDVNIKGCPPRIARSDGMQLLEPRR